MLVELWINFDISKVLMVPHNVILPVVSPVLRQYGKVKGDHCWRLVCLFPAGMDPIPFCPFEDRGYIQFCLSDINYRANEDMIDASVRDKENIK